MINPHGPKDMDAPIKHVSHQEKKTIVKSTYIWFGIIGLLLCSPLINFILVPIAAMIGLGAYIIYITFKYAKKPGEVLDPPESSSRDEMPGFTLPRTQDAGKKLEEKNSDSRTA